MTTVWVFVLLFFLPSFGGETHVRFEFNTEDGCQRIQKVVIRQLAENGMQKYTLLQDCTQESVSR